MLTVFLPKVCLRRFRTSEEHYSFLSRISIRQNMQCCAHSVRLS